jgi:hypothetical protein
MTPLVRRRAQRAGMCGAGLLALGWWLAPRPSRDVPTKTPRQAARALLQRPSRSPAPVVAPAAASAPQNQSKAPIIDEVIIEKPELCAGEETLVTVRAHSPDGNDADLHYLVGPSTGQRVPLRAWPDEQGNPPTFRVTVFGADNVSTAQSLPPLRLLPCRVAEFAVLSHRNLPNRWSTFEFRAQLRSPDASVAPAVASRYRWKFGDGSEAETSTPEVTHDYEERPEQTLYSQFLVQVEVARGDGTSLIARDALQLENPAYEAWSRKGIVTLLVALDPVFPALSAQGVVDQTIRLRHARPDPVTIESVRAVRARDDGSTESEPIDVGALLGTARIPAGRGLELRVQLDTQRMPDVLAVTYYLKGRSAEGQPVIGSFSVMRPPPRPTPENSTPITDPRQVAKIERARQQLGKDVVSDEDLARLEREGAFRDL